MAITDYLRSLFKIPYSKLITLNLFDTKSRDATTIRREIISTRLFLILFLISISIISLYTSISIHVQTKVMNFPTQIEYEKLLEKYPNSLQCPCTQISILYDDFAKIKPSFHQVCSSDFVSQEWIDFTFGTNTTFIWPMDVRTNMSAMWQIIAALCKYSNATFTEILSSFVSTQLTSSTILPKNLLETQINIIINLIHQTASDTLLQSLAVSHEITQSSGLLSDLLTNSIYL
jgi:hypothetical protein